MQDVIYKRITDNGKVNYELADNTLEGFYKTIMFPFVLMYCVLMIADICVAMFRLSNDWCDWNCSVFYVVICYIFCRELNAIMV